jgi:hypothetical protein
MQTETVLTFLNYSRKRSHSEGHLATLLLAIQHYFHYLQENLTFPLVVESEAWLNWTKIWFKDINGLYLTQAGAAAKAHSEIHR